MRAWSDRRPGKGGVRDQDGTVSSSDGRLLPRFYLLASNLQRSLDGSRSGRINRRIPRGYSEYSNKFIGSWAAKRGSQVSPVSAALILRVGYGANEWWEVR